MRCLGPLPAYGIPTLQGPAACLFDALERSVIECTLEVIPPHDLRLTIPGLPAPTFCGRPEGTHAGTSVPQVALALASGLDPVTCDSREIAQLRGACCLHNLQSCALRAR